MYFRIALVNAVMGQSFTYRLAEELSPSREAILDKFSWLLRKILRMVFSVIAMM